MMNFFKRGRGSRNESRRHASLPLRQPRINDPRESYIFRRSRTLTGSAANDVKTAITPQPSDLQSERLKLHELQQRRRTLMGIAFMSIIVAFGIWYLLASTITGARVMVQNEQPTVAEQQKVMQTIQDYVNNYPTEAFTLTLHMERFMLYMQRAYPEIASIRLQSKWLGLERSFLITYRQALAAWQIGDKRFYIDSEGIAFTALHGPEPALKVEDASGFKPSDDNSVASKRFIRYLGQLLAAIQVKQVGIVERIVIPASTRELDVYLKDRPYPIKTHIDRDPYKQVDDMTAALGFMDEKHLRPQYVDIRVEGRAYYK